MLELAVFHMGPHAAAMLGDPGAKVIKIEERGLGLTDTELRILGVDMAGS